MTRSLVVAAAVVGIEVEGAFTEVAAVGFMAAAIEVACVRHIPSRAAQGVPLPVVPVVRVTQSLVVPVVR